MRKFLLALVAVVVVIGGFTLAGTIETHYTRESTVTEVADNLIYVEDDLGNLWSFYGDDFKAGDRVRLYIYDNGTTPVEDDEIQGASLIE